MAFGQILIDSFFGDFICQPPLQQSGLFQYFDRVRLQPLARAEYRSKAPSKRVSMTASDLR
jgi:hypothetical protein